MEMSLFKLYSIGRAAENKKISSHDIEVYPIEHMGYVNGDVNSEKTENEASGVDANGKSYSVKVESSNSIKATWFPWGSNRITPPDVRRGERLLIWRYADTDKYYWTPSGLDDHLRRLETVVYAFSNTRDESTKVLSPDNSYYLEVNTHTKHITLGTNKSDGEPFAYTFQFNTKDGIVTLTDHTGNYIEFNSRDTKITVENADKSLLELDRTIINLTSTDAVNIKTKAYALDAETVKVNASASITYKSPTFNITASTSIKGDFSTTGSFTNNSKAVGSTHTHPDPQGGTVPPPN